MIEPARVEEVDRAVRSSRPYHRWDRLDDRVKIAFTAPQLLFRRLAFLNIETRSIPLNDVAVCIAKWNFPVEHPAVFSIRPTDASFVFEDFPCCEAGSPFGHNSINVFRVNESGPVPAGHFVQSDAQVLQPTLIEVIEVTVGPGGVNQRRDRVDQELGIQTLGSLSRGGHGGHDTPDESTYR